MVPSRHFARTTLLLLLAILLVFAGPAAAQTFPKLTGRVVDQADLLRPEQEIDIDSKLAALEAQTGRQFVVATINSLEGRTIEDYGYRLGRTWAIGDKEKDDGVVLLVAPKERKVRIETGYGARVFLTDAVSSVIIRNDILPRFKDGDMGGGIVAGTDAIIAQLQLSPEEAARRAQQAERTEREPDNEFGFIPVIFIVVMFFVIIGSIARRAGGRRYRSHDGKRRRGGLDSGDLAVILWGLDALSKASRGRGGGWGGGGWGGGGGGGWGGGGFSGGGGSFGGGGASGSW